MTHIHVPIPTQVGVDENDQPIYELVAGYHIDTLTPITGADAFLVDPEPNTPYHGFSGRPLDEVYRYKFDDEAHYREFVPLPEELEDEA